MKRATASQLSVAAKTAGRRAPRLGRLPAAQGKQKMAQVLDIARDHFARFGFQGTTVDAIAAEAGVTKRTIYAWHTDKTSLLVACIKNGAENLATLRIAASQDHDAALRAYGAEVLEILTRPASVGLALMYFRDGRDFPALAAAMRTATDDYMVAPAAAYLRQQGMPRAAAIARATIFVSMLMSDLHRRLLLGEALPAQHEIAEHVALVVAIFLHGSSLADAAPSVASHTPKAELPARALNNRRSASA